MDIGELLAFAVKNGASDLHLSAGLPPMIRVDGDVRRINVPAMEHKEVHDLIYDIMNDTTRSSSNATSHSKSPDWRVFASTLSTRTAALARYFVQFLPKF
jgi:Tfp pilus assembly pilus retraction ATPase PilT